MTKTPKKFEPVEVYPLADFLYEEMKARDWTTKDVAVRMKTGSGYEADQLAIDLFMSEQGDDLLVGDRLFAGLAKAFGINEYYFRTLDATWRAYPDRRVPFECPDEIFGVEWMGPAND